MSNKCDNSDCHKKNPSHEKEISRMNRAIGQMEGIKKMILDNRYCPDILIQLKAINSAIKSIERNILKTHIEHCVATSFENKEEQKEKIEEVIKLLDRFQN